MYLVYSITDRKNSHQISPKWARAIISHFHNYASNQTDNGEHE